jgi:hypothetical protein
LTNPTGEAQDGILRPDFDRRVMLQFRGSVVTSDAGLLAYRELDDALGLSSSAGDRLADARTGKNGRHALVGMLRQAVFARLAEYEDVNDAERLRHDPVVSHGRYVTFQMAEVAIPRQLFASIMQRIAALRSPPMATAT